jgi:hypothetical protein
MPTAYLPKLSYEHRGQLWRHFVSTMNDTAGKPVAEIPAGAVIGFAHRRLKRSGVSDYQGELYALYLVAELRRCLIPAYGSVSLKPRRMPLGL